jgi:hypothetical protein
LKEQHYLRQIAKLEENLKEDGSLRQERYDKTMESLRNRHKLVLDQKEDEISDLSLKLSEKTEHADKYRLEKDSLRDQHDKLKDCLRDLKEESAAKFDRQQKKSGESDF